jgi:hypothetical protein
MTKDEVIAWVAPLMSEALDKGMSLKPEIRLATETPEGRVGRMNWLLFGQLVIRRLGLEDSYPAEPAEEPQGIEFYQRFINPE